MRRIVYDVNVETGAWTLQQASDREQKKLLTDLSL
jgi:hypothetical protein